LEYVSVNFLPTFFVLNQTIFSANTEHSAQIISKPDIINANQVQRRHNNGEKKARKQKLTGFLKSTKKAVMLICVVIF
jgi:hypothetical protein